MIDYTDGFGICVCLHLLSFFFFRMCVAIPICWNGCIQNLNSGHLQSRHSIDWIDISIMAFITHRCLHCGSLSCFRAFSQLLEHRDTEKLLSPLSCYYPPWRKGQSLRLWWSLKMSQYLRHQSRVASSKFFLLFLHHQNMHLQMYLILCTSPSCVWPRMFPAASHPVHNLKSLSPLTVYGTKILWHSPCPLHPIKTFSLSC